MGKLRVRRLGYAMGASIEGVDFTRPVDDETIAEIRQAWLEHIVICIPGQDLNVEQMVATCSRFGELYDHTSSPENTLPGYPTVKVLSNKPVEVDGRGYSGYLTGRKWHSDTSFKQNTGWATLLVAKQLPDVGGDTMFANMYLAFETLSPAMQKLVESLSGIHDHTLSGNYKLKTPDLQAADALISPPVIHPAVIVHPETGRKALFVNPRVRRFLGMTEEESRPILDFLHQHSTRYEFLYRHRWTVNDFVMWDNRASMHIAVQDYDQSQIRRMLRCTILGPKTGRIYSAEDESRLATAGRSS